MNNGSEQLIKVLHQGNGYGVKTFINVISE